MINWFKFSIVSFLLLKSVNFTLATELNSNVYRVMLVDCGYKNIGYVQTGFRGFWNGQHGIVTALHGVAGCNRYYVTQGENVYLDDLTLTAVDYDKDVAFLSSSQLANEPGAALPKANFNINQDQLKVIGYPDGALEQFSNFLRYHENPLRKLGSWHQTVTNMCQQRQSPKCDIDVLLVANEVLIPGYSGAPVFNQNNEVVGIADGGLKGGTAMMNWIIPYANVSLKDARSFSNDINHLKQQDITALFATVSTLDDSKFPTGHGATISGRVLYGGYSGNPIGIVTQFSKAYAVIQLMQTDTRKEIPVDFSYDNNTGIYSIKNVPVGKFTVFIRLESGYPFHKMSGGDFVSILSGLNDDIVVAPHEKNISRDLKVVYSTHLIQPVDNQKERTFANDPPELLYRQNYYPTVSLFEWGQVPGADFYEVRFLLIDGNTRQIINNNTFKTQSTRIQPNLNVTNGNNYYSFLVYAYNKNGLIGGFNNFYKNGYGGWFNFRVAERP
jgi:hypothetical protein